MRIKGKIFIGGLVAICIVIAMYVYNSLYEINYAKVVDTTKLEDVQIVNDMVLMAYASKERAIFYYSFGLFIFDIQNQKIYRSIDLKAIDSNYINGSTYTEILTTTDGKTVYIYNMGDKADNFMYVYDVEANKLTKVNRNETKDKYNVMLTAENPPDGYKNHEGAYSPVIARIDKDTFAYMYSENLIAKDLQLIVYNEINHSKEIYNVFRWYIAGYKHNGRNAVVLV